MGGIELAETDWAAPIICNPRKKGYLCFCVEYWKMNSITVHHSYPIRRMDERIDSLGDTVILFNVMQIAEIGKLGSTTHIATKTSFHIASWSVQNFKKFIWIAQHFWYTSKNNRCNIIANKMAICPCLSRRYHHMFRKCTRTYIARLYCTVALTQSYCQIEC